MTLSEFLASWLGPSENVEAHTSGSTGAPKTILLRKDDLRQSARATIEFFSIGPDDLLALPLAIDYIAGKMMTVRAVESRATLWVEPPSRHPLAELGEGAHVKLAAIVPQQIDGIIEAQCPIEHIIVGGAPTSAELEARALAGRSDTRWWATYGMTETASHVALRPFGSDSYRALPGVTFATDARGCLIITRAGASWSPVATNDIVRLLSPEEFIFLGRADNVIISGGVKIHPEEVERLIAPALAGRTYVVVGRPSERWGEEPILVVEGEADADGGTARLERCAALAGHILRPRAITFIPALPRTSTGKILRRL